MAPRVITFAAIATARAMLESRAEAADAGVDLDDLDDDVVIARDVTQGDLDGVPDAWLDGLAVVLRADGALVAISTRSDAQPFTSDEDSTDITASSAHSNSAPSNTPNSPKTLEQAMPITFSAIATARAVLERRVRQESGDDDVNEADDFDDVVIARDVTPDDLDNVPGEWLHGLKLTLRDDNTLVVEFLISEQHESATDAIREQVKEYGQANGFEVHSRTAKRQTGGRRKVLAPHILVARRSEHGGCEPFVVFMVADWQFTGPDMLKSARDLLDEYPLALCVVCFKFYPANTDADKLRAPAFAIVLERGNNGRVHMTQTRAMGNRGVHEVALRIFRGTNAFDDLLDNPAPANGLGELLAPSPLFPDAIPLAYIWTSLTRALENARELERARLDAGLHDDQVYFHVVVQGAPLIRVDLAAIFIAGMHGWACVPAHDALCRGARLAAAARAASAADGDVAVDGDVGMDWGVALAEAGEQLWLEWL